MGRSVCLEVWYGATHWILVKAMLRFLGFISRNGKVLRGLLDNEIAVPSNKREDF